MALELTVTAKGQVTMRRAVLDHLDVRPGDKIGVTLLPDGRVELRSNQTAPSLTTLAGAMRRLGQHPISLEEMQDAIEAGRDR